MNTWAFQVVLVVRNPSASVGDTTDVGSIPGREDPLEEEMAPYSSILAWKYSWTKEAVGLQSMGLQREAKSRAPPNCYYYCECQTCNLSVAY